MLSAQNEQLEAGKGLIYPFNCKSIILYVYLNDLESLDTIVKFKTSLTILYYTILYYTFYSMVKHIICADILRVAQYFPEARRGEEKYEQ